MEISDNNETHQLQVSSPFCIWREHPLTLFSAKLSPAQTLWMRSSCWGYHRVHVLKPLWTCPFGAALLPLKMIFWNKWKCFLFWGDPSIFTPSPPTTIMAQSKSKEPEVACICRGVGIANLVVKDPATWESLHQNLWITNDGDCKVALRTRREWKSTLSLFALLAAKLLGRYFAPWREQRCHLSVGQSGGDW